MAAISVLLSSCANEVAPTGGPKDETPPKVLKYSPEIYSTNFKEKTIEITFDEFFQLNNYKSKLLISPPFKNEPTFTVKGKKLIINLKDNLIPNTTYKIFLGDAIVDYNESKPYPNFSYIFSTGESIESLTLSGTLKDAYTLKPVENAYIFLYKDLS
ncbi:MAG: Ig-like domain-containing protein, partial [Bacteroidales bacterium]|nr:Ig-like domain-containing protein [Bacteroidales bacterium]